MPMGCPDRQTTRPVGLVAVMTVVWDAAVVVRVVDGEVRFGRFVVLGALNADVAIAVHFVAQRTCRNEVFSDLGVGCVIETDFVTVTAVPALTVENVMFANPNVPDDGSFSAVRMYLGSDASSMAMEQRAPVARDEVLAMRSRNVIRVADA